MKDRIDLIPANPTIAVYVNGKLRFESTSWAIPEATWIRLGQEYPNAEIHRRYADVSWLENRESFPENLEDIVFNEET